MIFYIRTFGVCRYLHFFLSPAVVCLDRCLIFYGSFLVLWALASLSSLCLIFDTVSSSFPVLFWSCFPCVCLVSLLCWWPALAWLASPVSCCVSSTLLPVPLISSVSRHFPGVISRKFKTKLCCWHSPLFLYIHQFFIRMSRKDKTC